jgi:hypothetical protein
VGSRQNIFFTHQLAHENIASKSFKNIPNFGWVNRVEIGNKRQRQNEKKHHPILEEVFFRS